MFSLQRPNHGSGEEIEEGEIGFARPKRLLRHNPARAKRPKWRNLLVRRFGPSLRKRRAFGGANSRRNSTTSRPETKLELLILLKFI